MPQDCKYKMQIASQILESPSANSTAESSKLASVPLLEHRLASPLPLALSSLYDEQPGKLIIWLGSFPRNVYFS